MNTKILQIGFRNEGADCVRHSADTKLEAGSVRNLGNDQLSNGLIDLCCGSSSAHLSDGGVISFYDHIDLGDVDPFLGSAVAYRHVFVHFHDNDLGGFTYSSHVGGIGAEVEVSVLIHRSNLKNSDIRLR